MKTVFWWVVGIVAVLVGAFFAFNFYIYNEKQADVVENYMNASYRIDGEIVELHDEASQTEVAPESASSIITEYFGNDLIVDLDDDGREDVVFLLTQITGGSGTFYYVVAARNTADGYVGSDGYFLGDRIAPQTINVSQNPRHVNVVVVNYADRAAEEPFSTQPSVGKSVYLKLDVESMRWGIVEPNFEGESR